MASLRQHVVPLVALCVLVVQWRRWVALVSFLDMGTVSPYLPLHICDLTNTLLTGMFLRANVNHPVHWLRLFICSMVLTMGKQWPQLIQYSTQDVIHALAGGSTITAMLAGRPPRWLVMPASFYSAVVGYLLIFHCPGDIVFSVYRQPVLRPFFDVMRGIATAHSMSSSAVERALNTPFENRAGAHSFFILSFLGGAGSALAAEFLNVLLLPRAAYMRPRNGPAPGAITSLLAAIAYVAVIRDPAGKLYGPQGTHDLLAMPRAMIERQMPGVEAWLCSVGAWLETYWCGSASLPLAHDRASGVAMLAVVTIALQLRVLGTDAELQDSAAAVFRKVLPSFRTVLVPTAVASPFAASIDAAFARIGRLLQSSPQVAGGGVVAVADGTPSGVAADGRNGIRSGDAVTSTSPLRTSTTTSSRAEDADGNNAGLKRLPSTARRRRPLALLGSQADAGVDAGTAVAATSTPTDVNPQQPQPQEEQHQQQQRLLASLAQARTSDLGVFGYVRLGVPVATVAPG